METYRVRLMGQTPYIQHSDNVEWADEMERWLRNPDNKKSSTPGDDRTPAFRWLGCLYHDGTQIVVPSDSIRAALREAGATLSTGHRTETFKSASQSGLIINEAAWPLVVNERTIPTAPFMESKEIRSFADWQRLAAGYGFMLFVKRVRVGMSKHIRVRPVFDSWASEGTITVTDTRITEQVLQMLVSQAGRLKGIGDWRPGGRTPGTFGMFKADVELVE